MERVRAYVIWLATFAHNLRERGLLFAVVFGAETAPKKRTKNTVSGKNKFNKAEQPTQVMR